MADGFRSLHAFWVGGGGEATPSVTTNGAGAATVTFDQTGVGGATRPAAGSATVLFDVVVGYGVAIQIVPGVGTATVTFAGAGIGLVVTGISAVDEGDLLVVTRDDGMLGV